MSGFSEQAGGQFIVADNPIMDADRISGRVELYAEDGSPYSLLRKKVVTIPHEWLLANIKEVVVEDTPVGFEVLPSHPGRTYLVITGLAKLVFNSVPYVGSESGVALYLDNQLHPFSEPTTSIFEADFGTGDWSSTDTKVAVFQWANPAGGYKVFETPIYFYGVSGSSLTEGDSDLELTLYYVQNDGESS